MKLALAVLKNPLAGAEQIGVNTPAVRLALRVLRPFLPDRSLLVRFWDEGELAKTTATNEAHFACGWIAQALLKQGHSVWADFRLR